LVGLSPVQITGTYWTDRFTVGDMDLRHLNRRRDYTTLAEVLQDAQRRNAC
jgi:hypothetical protein